jgi:hypothetical protein
MIAATTRHPAAINDRVKRTPNESCSDELRTIDSDPETSGVGLLIFARLRE